MNVNKYTDQYKEHWNRFNTTSKNGLFLFDINYLFYHADRFNDHSLIVEDNKNVTKAIFPACAIDNKIYSHAGLTFGSLITGHDIKAKEVLEIVSDICNYYRQQGFTEIIYKTIPYIFHKYCADEDLYALYRMEAQLIRRDISSVIPLKNKIRFSETKRQLIAKCKKNNVTVSEVKNFTSYWSLLEEVLLKFNTKPVHSLQEITLLAELFPNHIKLYEARVEGRLAAGIVIYDYGQVVHTQYMASSEEGRKIGALDYINHYLINDVYAEREFYSFGISTEDKGMKLNEGLIQQKENMGARAVALDFYKIKL